MLNRLQSPAHVKELEVGSRDGTRVFLPVLFVDVDAFVVEELILASRINFLTLPK